MFCAIDVFEDTEGVAAVDAVGCPFLHLPWIERCLCSGDSGAGGSAGFSGNGIGAVGIREIIVKGQPEAGAGSCRATGNCDLLLIEIPFGGFAADELQCAGGIVEAGFDWWLNTVSEGFFDEAVFDGNDRNPVFMHRGNPGGHAGHPVSVLPAASVNEEQAGSGCAGICFPESQNLFWVCAVADGFESWCGWWSSFFGGFLFGFCWCFGCGLLLGLVFLGGFVGIGCGAEEQADKDQKWQQKS